MTLLSIHSVYDGIDEASNRVLGREELDCPATCLAHGNGSTHDRSGIDDAGEALDILDMSQLRPPVCLSMPHRWDDPLPRSQLEAELRGS